MGFPSENYPTVNGAICSWAKLTVKIFGERAVGIQKATWKHGLEQKKIQGRGSEPLGVVEGVYSAEASIELLIADSRYLKRYLTGIAGLGFFQQEFQASLHYKIENGSEMLISLVNCKLNESSSDASAGSSDAIVVPHPLTVMRIIEDGMYGVQPGT